MKVPAGIALVVLIGILLTGCSAQVASPPSYPLPSITGFSRDTVMTEDSVTIFGQNLVAATLTIGDVRATIGDVPDTSKASAVGNSVVIFLPGAAKTDFVYAATASGERVKSPHVLNVRHPFSVFSATPDSASIGQTVTIFGRGFLERRDSLSLLLNNLLVNIDSIFDDSIKFTIPPNASCGELDLIYQDRAFSIQTNFVVTRPFRYSTFVLEVNGLHVTAQHRRTGYINFHQRVDSSWSDTATFNWKVTSAIPKTTFIQAPTGLQMNCALPVVSSTLSSPSLFILWDTIQKKFTASIVVEGHAEGILPLSFSRDTTVNVSVISTVTSLPDVPLEIDLPFDVTPPYVYINLEDSESDHKNEYSWQETITLTTDGTRPSHTKLIFRLIP